MFDKCIYLQNQNSREEKSANASGFYEFIILARKIYIYMDQRKKKYKYI